MAKKKASKAGSLVSDIKNQIKKNGTSKGKIIYFKPGVKVRIRVLQDLDDGLKLPFHDSFNLGVNYPCQELFDRECEGCNDDELRHRDQYAWSVYDYDSKEVKILLGPANQYSPIPNLVGMYEAYETMTDRDYIITKNGQGTSTTFSVVPMDKVKFKNKEAKPFTESKMLALIDKAFPADTDDEDEKPNKKKRASKKDSSKKSKRYEEEEDLDEDDDLDEDEAPDYEEMDAKELYKLCKQREISCKPKKDEEYYIELLEEYDEENDDSDDEEDEDEW